LVVFCGDEEGVCDENSLREIGISLVGFTAVEAWSQYKIDASKLARDVKMTKAKFTLR
jgi:hypothetical protein